MVQVGGLSNMEIIKISKTMQQADSKAIATLTVAVLALSVFECKGPTK